MRGNVGAVVLIVLGLLGLAINLGALDIDFVRLLRTWWPALLIVLGIGMFLAPGTDDRRKPD